MSQLIVIPRLEVRNANAQPAWWMIGPPPVTAYLGFAHALALRIGAAGHEGIAIIHHDIQFLGERHYDTLLPHQFRAASFIDKSDYSSKNPHVLSSQPTARCHLNVSVVISLPDDALFHMDDVTVFLRGARLAGGTVVDSGKSAYFHTADDLTKVLSQVGAGFSVVSRQDLMVLEEGEHDMLDVLLRLTRPTEKRTDDQKWLLPTALGFIEITPRKQRRKVRGDFPHAYAEPLVGLIQYRTLRDAGLHFWRYQHPKPNVFVASTYSLEGATS